MPAVASPPVPRLSDVRSLCRRAPVVLVAARAVPRAEAGGEDVIEMIGSTEEVARDRGIIRLDGWKLDGYEKTGAPFLWCHDAYSMPNIGNSKRTWTDASDRTLRFRIAFVSRDLFPFAGLVRDLYAEGVMRCTSVGFQVLRMEDPTDAEVAKGARWVSLEQNLLELSAVPVPADPGAVAVKKAFADLVRRGVVKGDGARELAEIAAACYGLHAGELLFARKAMVDFWNEGAALLRAQTPILGACHSAATVGEDADGFRSEIRPAAEFTGAFAERLVQTEPEVRGQVGALADGESKGKLAIHACTFPKSAWSKADDVTAWINQHGDQLRAWTEDAPEAEEPAEGEGEEGADEADPEAEVEEDAEKATPQGVIRQIVDVRATLRGLDALLGAAVRDAGALLKVEAGAGSAADADDVAHALGEPGGVSTNAAEATALRTLSATIDRLTAFNREAVAVAAAKAAGDAVTAALAPFLPALESLRKRLSTAPAAKPPAARTPLYAQRPHARNGAPVLPVLSPDLIRACRGPVT